MRPPLLHHCLGVEAILLGKLREPSLRSLYRCLDGVTGLGAAVTATSPARMKVGLGPAGDFGVLLEPKQSFSTCSRGSSP